MTENNLTLPGIDWDVLDTENQINTEFWGLLIKHFNYDPYAERAINELFKGVNND